MAWKGGYGVKKIEFLKQHGYRRDLCCGSWSYISSRSGTWHHEIARFTDENGLGTKSKWKRKEKSRSLQSGREQREGEGWVCSFWREAREGDAMQFRELWREREREAFTWG